MGKYTLVVAEKPDVAGKIAIALDAVGKPREMQENRIPYYVAERDKTIVVVPALGHMYTVTEDERERSHFPVFSFRWAPRHVTARLAKRTRVWLEVISKLAENADTFVDACDYDIEGSVIGYNILKYACYGKEHNAKRMKYSTLTKQELQESYARLLPHLDFGLIEAGLARHEVDWLYGINLSRALTTAVRGYGARCTMLSTGRVQGPTLGFIVAREKAIRSFVPVPSWEVRATVEIGGQTLNILHEKKTVETKREAKEILETCSDNNGTVLGISVKEHAELPPVPFDLGTLQSEAYHLFGYKPSYTLNIAQHLYLDAVISYPRTSSQEIPPTVDCEAILRNLRKVSKYRKLTEELLAKSELRARKGEKEDPAHPAIYPTGNLPTRVLDRSERNMLDLIIRRFMATLSAPAMRRITRVSININGHDFRLVGKRTFKKGWVRFYESYARSHEIILPSIEKGQQVTINELSLDARFTKPPPRYNPSDMLKRMEAIEIGTKATRADIIQTLYDRKYVIDEWTKVTDLGFEVVDILEQYCPDIVSTKLTRELEERMNRLRTGSEEREGVLKDTVEILRPALAKLKCHERAIGKQLGEAIKRSELEERTLGRCRACQTGYLVTLHSRKSGKRFVGCTNYFRGLCKTSFPLPQKGVIRSLDKTCPKCGWPTVQVRTSRRLWNLCINSHCPLKEVTR